VAIEMGIITIQKSVSHPFTRRVNTGSPWTDAQSVFIVSVIARLLLLSTLGSRSSAERGSLGDPVGNTVGCPSGRDDDCHAERHDAERHQVQGR
jgi:hypothetical protein